MQGFYIKGGVYADTTFAELQIPESYGPFDTYQEAYDVWQGKARFNVDNACHRLTVSLVLDEDEVNVSGVGC